MAHYRFESEWVLSATIGAVFEVLVHPESYSDWWPSVRNSQLIDQGDEAGIGSKAKYYLRSPLLFGMNFATKTVDIDPPRRIHSLVRGELVGTATYTLDSTDAGTRVRIAWHVSTAKRWMDVLTPAAKPLFVWAHHIFMREGCAALARRLGARLISTKTRLNDSREPLPAA